LDAFCYLPHPVGLPPRDGEPERRGLPAHEVRKLYHEQLDRFASHARRFLQNATLLGLELPRHRDASEPLGGLPICRLAALSVEERLDARIRSRLMGSSFTHCLLIMRDWWVYGSDSSFTPKAMIANRRKKMQAKGENPTDEDVCRAVVESSTRSNKDYDKAAKALEDRQQGYVAETISAYLWPSFVLATIVHLVQVFWEYLQRRAEGKFEEGDNWRAAEEAPLTTAPKQPPTSPSQPPQPQAAASSAGAQGEGTCQWRGHGPPSVQHAGRFPPEHWRIAI